MNSIYEELKRKLGDEFDPNAGFSTLDMIHFPAPVRRIVRIMLRKAEMSHEELHKKIQELPEEKRPSPKEVDDSLEAMIEVGWLERVERDGGNLYRIDMGKKSGSEVTRASPNQKTKSTMSKLWDTFDEAAKEEGKPALDLRREKGTASTSDILAGLGEGKEEEKKEKEKEETPPDPIKAEAEPNKAATPLSSTPSASDKKEPVKETKEAPMITQQDATPTGPPKLSRPEPKKKAGKRLLDSLFKSDKDKEE